ncbi:MAG: 16S rRNA (adenine(1518)-N(6)/adenine(1519)-N(6))-dimethyltransferase RsmA [Phycisphaerales bacterium]
MQTQREIRHLLESRGLAPRKSLGQNFLIDQNLIRRLVEASGAAPGDLILEVGPGTGALTEALLARGCRVVAVEVDRGLAALLRERLADPQAALNAPPEASFTLIEGDALAGKHALNPDAAAALGSGPFHLVANLPYGAATPLLLALLIDHPRCGSMHITIQREVADRLLASPGTKEYGPITVVARALARPERLATLPPECFWPRPDVTSAMVSLTRLPQPLTDRPRALADFAQTLFTKRRKQLGAVLGRQFPFPPDIHPDQRAEALTPEKFVALARAAASL